MGGPHMGPTHLGPTWAQVGKYGCKIFSGIWSQFFMGEKYFQEFASIFSMGEKYFQESASNFFMGEKYFQESASKFFMGEKHFQEFASIFFMDEKYFQEFVSNFFMGAHPLGPSVGPPTWAQTPPPPAPPDEFSDPNLTPLPTHPGIKYVARTLAAMLSLFHVSVAARAPGCLQRI